MDPTLEIAVLDPQGPKPCRVPVARMWDFGYAARDEEGLGRHLAETAGRGLPVSATVPSLYGLPPDRLTTASAIAVSGDETYAEVEYGLIRTEDFGWLVVVASDNTDGLIEAASVSRGTAIMLNVISATAWRLANLGDHFDPLVLTCETVNGEPEVVQRAATESLLSPWQLIEIAERRVGTLPALLSGTIDGVSPRGRRGSHISLHDPVTGDTLEHEYTVDVIEDEVREPRSAQAVSR